MEGTAATLHAVALHHHGRHRLHALHHHCTHTFQCLHEIHLPVLAPWDRKRVAFLFVADTKTSASITRVQLQNLLNEDRAPCRFATRVVVELG